MTKERIAAHLGVRRAGITVVAAAMQAIASSICWSLMRTLPRLSANATGLSP